MMHELQCGMCKKIIGFVNRRFYKDKDGMTIIKCIDCYFKELKKI